jgi:hypothetical protein
MPGVKMDSISQSAKAGANACGRAQFRMFQARNFINCDILFSVTYSL